MTQLILSPRNTDDIRALARAADERGWVVSRLSSWRLPGDSPVAESLAIYGEPLFARIVAAQCNRVLLEPPLDWLARLPLELTHRKIRFVRFSELGCLEYPCFIKPPDDKLFTARVYEDADELTRRTDIPDEQEILVSDPVQFAKEFRVHVVRGTAVSVSRYSEYGELSVCAQDDNCKSAAAFATELFQQVQSFTPPSVVIDVGLLDGSAWSVVEANPVFGAGIYDGNAALILDALVEACHRPKRPDPYLDQFFRPVELE
ncbi:MAG: ATP-grasp domain-containing protein [Gammaproteobacteria bacterium]